MSSLSAGRASNDNPRSAGWLGLGRERPKASWAMLGTGLTPALGRQDRLTRHSATTYHPGDPSPPLAIDFNPSRGSHPHVSDGPERRRVCDARHGAARREAMTG